MAREQRSGPEEARSNVTGLQPGLERQTEATDAGAELVDRMSEVGWGQWRLTQDIAKLGMDAAGRMMQCRDIEEAMEIQREYVKASVDRVFDESKQAFSMSFQMLDRLRTAQENVQARTERL